MRMLICTSHNVRMYDNECKKYNDRWFIVVERAERSDDEEWAYKNEFYAADGQCSFKTDINK